MPRPRRSHGRPGTEVIPARWATDHQPVAEKTMVGAKATFRKPGTQQSWSAEQEQMIAVPKTPYAAGLRCRAQALPTQARDVVAAEDTETVAAYLITVTADLNPLEGDLVQLDVCDDPALDGLRLEIQQVVRGSILWERDLMCTLTD